MLTHIVCHIFRMARPTNFKFGKRMEDDDPHQRQARWPTRSKVKVTRSRDQSEPCWPNGHKSKTNSCSITKIGRKVPHDTCYIAHLFQGQKVKDRGHRPTNADTQMCHILRTVRHKNFIVGMRMEDVDPHSSKCHDFHSQISRSQGHMVCLTRMGHILRNLHLVLWQSTKTCIIDNRGDLQGQRSTS